MHFERAEVFLFVYNCIRGRDGSCMGRAARAGDVFLIFLGAAGAGWREEKWIVLICWGLMVPLRVMVYPLRVIVGSLCVMVIYLEITFYVTPKTCTHLLCNPHTVERGFGAWRSVVQTQSMLSTAAAGGRSKRDQVT